MNWKCDFSYRHYFEVLDYAKDHYYIYPISEIPKSNNKNQFLVLRHDIDFSLDYALRLAEKEHKKGIASTYFVLLHCEYYNALSEDGTKVIRRISELGHEIGLHYDTNFLTEKPSSAIRQIKEEKRLLENITNKKVVSVAQHNPSISRKLNLSLEKHSLVDAGNSRHMDGVKYISDSVQNWRNGCMCNHVEREKKLQILTHPLWWSSRPTSRTKILSILQKDKTAKIQRLVKSSHHVHESYIRNLRSRNIN
ncbi:MAG: hypothetical protein KGI27_08160 [Thaumarchaeota archaeon]|nr:hypothetical protein [Nitrososphaerota archaeon]